MEQNFAREQLNNPEGIACPHEHSPSMSKIMLTGDLEGKGQDHLVRSEVSENVTKIFIHGSLEDRADYWRQKGGTYGEQMKRWLGSTVSWIESQRQNPDSAIMFDVLKGVEIGDITDEDRSKYIEHADMKALVGKINANLPQGAEPMELENMSNTQLEVLSLYEYFLDKKSSPEEQNSTTRALLDVLNVSIAGSDEAPYPDEEVEKRLASIGPFLRIFGLEGQHGLSAMLAAEVHAVIQPEKVQAAQVDDASLNATDKKALGFFSKYKDTVVIGDDKGGADEEDDGGAGGARQTEPIQPVVQPLDEPVGQAVSEPASPAAQPSTSQPSKLSGYVTIKEVVERPETATPGGSNPGGQSFDSPSAVYSHELMSVPPSAPVVGPSQRLESEYATAEGGIPREIAEKIEALAQNNAISYLDRRVAYCEALAEQDPQRRDSLLAYALGINPQILYVWNENIQKNLNEERNGTLLDLGWLNKSISVSVLEHVPEIQAIRDKRRDASPSEVKLNTEAKQLIISRMGETAQQRMTRDFGPLIKDLGVEVPQESLMSKVESSDASKLAESDIHELLKLSIHPPEGYTLKEGASRGKVLTSIIGSFDYALNTEYADTMAAFITKLPTKADQLYMLFLVYNRLQDLYKKKSHPYNYPGPDVPPAGGAVAIVLQQRQRPQNLDDLGGLLPDDEPTPPDGGPDGGDHGEGETTATLASSGDWQDEQVHRRDGYYQRPTVSTGY